MFDEQWQFAVEVEREYAQYRKKVMMRYHLSAAEVDILLFLANNAYSARTAHPFQRNGAPFRFKLSKAQQVD